MIKYIVEFDPTKFKDREDIFDTYYQIKNLLLDEKEQVIGVFDGVKIYAINIDENGTEIIVEPRTKIIREEINPDAKNN